VAASTGALPRADALPTTGRDTQPLVAAGVAAVGAGAILLLTRRRGPATGAGRR
jgi:LPXTG-motif cell wall-anchored protein